MTSSIKLDVGGTIFKTSRSTLIKYDCMFRGLLESGIPLETDESGCVFIDRDPTHFRCILNFLRDGNVKLPDNKDTIDEILKEAEFYSIQQLIDLCRSYECYDHREYRVAKSNAEMKKILIKATRDVLVFGFTPSHYRGLQIKYESIKKRIQKYKHEVDIVFVENLEKEPLYIYQPFNGSENRKQLVGHYTQVFQDLHNLWNG